MEEKQEVEYRIGILMGMGLVMIGFAFDILKFFWIL
jgi:hypothetical protein